MGGCSSEQIGIQGAILIRVGIEKPGGNNGDHVFKFHIPHVSGHGEGVVGRFGVEEVELGEDFLCAFCFCFFSTLLAVASFKGFGFLLFSSILRNKNEMTLL